MISVSQELLRESLEQEAALITKRGPAKKPKAQVLAAVDLATARRIQDISGAAFARIGRKRVADGGSVRFHTHYPEGTKAAEFSRDMSLWIATGIRKADLFWWSASLNDILHESAKTIPEVKLTPDMLPSPNGFLVFERPWQATDIYEPERTGWIRALSWCIDPETGMIGFALYDEDPNDPGVVGLFSASCSQVGRIVQYRHAVRLNEDGSPDLSSPDIQAGTAAVPVTALLFMGQKFVSTVQQRANRASRKEFPNRADDLINVVTLRKRAADSHSATARDVDWSCRWFVSPHWRNQAYGPGHSERRPILIPAYVKGPADRPLKPQPERIFKVSR